MLGYNGKMCPSREDGSRAEIVSHSHDTLVEEEDSLSLVRSQTAGQVRVHHHIHHRQSTAIVLQLCIYIYAESWKFLTKHS